METKVQTFELKESMEIAACPEQNEQYMAMIDELGLKGQKTLVTEGKDGQTTPIPYLWMNERLKNVFNTLCPTRVDIESYDKLPIPIIILGHVKQCQMRGWFAKVEVWYDDKQPDPVVVGLTEKKSEKAELYLIGRWGAEDRSLEALDAMALDRRTEQLRVGAQHHLASEQAEVAAVLADPRAVADKILSGDYHTAQYWR